VNPAAQAKLPELRDAEGKAAEAAAAAVRADEARTAAKEAAANAAEERSGAATAAANEAKVGAEKAQARASEARSEALAARTRADKVVAQLEGRAEPDPCTGTAPYDARPSVELLGDGYAQVVQLKDTSFSGKIPGASGGRLIVTIGFRGGINLARGTLDQDTKNASDSTH
jgi:hypothetical protein